MACEPGGIVGMLAKRPISFHHELDIAVEHTLTICVPRGRCADTMGMCTTCRKQHVHINRLDWLPQSSGMDSMNVYGKGWNGAPGGASHETPRNWPVALDRNRVICQAALEIV